MLTTVAPMEAKDHRRFPNLGSRRQNYGDETLARRVALDRSIFGRGSNDIELIQKDSYVIENANKAPD
jgi:hypothetical protein